VGLYFSVQSSTKKQCGANRWCLRFNFNVKNWRFYLCKLGLGIWFNSESHSYHCSRCQLVTKSLSSMYFSTKI